MKALVLISGGIDSIVASYLMRELNLIFIHFDNGEYGDGKSLDKCKKLIKILGRGKLYVVSYGRMHKEISKCNDRYHCIFCKRLMYKISEKIAKKENCDYLITGENLGQVASQTLDNLKAIDNIDMIILRPLICFNKEEIIDIARKIKTFDVSTIKSICCSALPRKPVTKAKLEKVRKEERKLNINEIIKDVDARLITID